MIAKLKRVWKTLVSLDYDLAVISENIKQIRNDQYRLIDKIAPFLDEQDPFRKAASDRLAAEAKARLYATADLDWRAGRTDSGDMM